MSFFTDSNKSGRPVAQNGPRAGSDYAPFLALVQETARLLHNFVAPDDFVPDAPLPPKPLPPEMLRHLGAPTLADFYALALEEFSEKRPAPLALFPEGPESIRPALVCLEREIARLKITLEDNPKTPDREKESRLLEIFRESRANLVRASRLWPKIKKEALIWPEEAAKLWRMTGRLEDGIGQVLKSFRVSGDIDTADENPGQSRRNGSLTRAAADLKKEVETAAALIAEKKQLTSRLTAVNSDMEGLLAAVMESENGHRDWAEVREEAERRVASIHLEATRLKTDTAETGKKLSQALGRLFELEEKMSARRDSGLLRDRLEAALRGVEALWDSTLDRRRALARLYFALPPRLGRPVFLEKTHLITAASLGRTQALLEEMRHRLTLAMGRLSSTHQLRREGTEAAERLAALPENAALLEQAERRLSALKRAVGQRLTLKRALSQNAETETELSRTRLDNERLTRHLKNAALESEHLREQLVAVRNSLGEMGSFKARLLKIYAKKNAMLQSVEQARQDFVRENAELKAAKAELKRKRARLAAMYTLERGDLSRLEREFDEQKDELALNRDLLKARREERDELIKRLENTRRERDELAVDQRDLEARTRALEDNLADAVTRAEALSAELHRVSEELAEATGARTALGERVSAMRRKLDLLAQAQAALQKNLRRKNARLDTAESERDQYRAKLTRQNANILRLVTVRQELRAELGHTRLRLSDLEKEKNEIFAQLTAHRARADAAEKTGEILKSRVGGLESENSRLLGRVDGLSGEVVQLTDEKLKLTDHLSAAEERKAELSRQLAALNGQLDDLAPLVSILGEALRYSEAAHGRTRAEAAGALSAFKAESGLMMEQIRLSADVREANIRLKAAARELDLGEASKTEQRDLARTLETREEALAEAKSRITTLEAQLQAFGSDYGFQRSQELGVAVSHLGLRNTKLRRALDVLKQRYGGRLDEARATESGLRDLIDSQNRELKRQKRRLGELEPLVTHFLEQAEKGLAPDNAADLALIRQMKSEAQSMRTELGVPADDAVAALSGALAARLAELQPLVAFLAKAFVRSTLDLAQARRERAALADDRKVLESSLSSRQDELAEIRGQAFEFAQECDELKSVVSEKDREIRLLKTELAEADRDLAENDGRLEAAWAGLNYLGAKAGDNLAKMKTRLENQTRQTDKLNLELKNRDTLIRELEDRQDKLALFYWTLVARVMVSEPPAETGAPLALPGTDRLEMEASEFTPAQDEPNGQGRYEVLDNARKTARHGLFTILLAGGLIMGGSAMAIETRPAPMENARLSAALESPFVGRQVSLDFVDSTVRVQGAAAVEAQVKERVNQVALGHSLSPQEFLQLLRQAQAPEARVHLGDFEGRAGVSALLATHFPKLAPELKGQPEQVRDLLKAAAAFRPEEGFFWERLYFNLAEKLSRADSLEGLLRLLERKNSLAAQGQPEFAGRLAAFADVDNMSPATFIQFMGGHLKDHWLLSGGRGRGARLRSLAGDLYFAARLYKLPPTLLASIAQWELEEGRAEALLDPRNATLFFYKKADEVADLALAGSEIWRDGRAPLCDMDGILAEHYGQMGMENIFRKKMKIVMSYNKMISQGRNLFGGLGSA